MWTLILTMHDRSDSSSRRPSSPRERRSMFLRAMEQVEIEESLAEVEMAVWGSE